jgi:hypothetical protein
METAEAFFFLNPLKDMLRININSKIKTNLSRLSKYFPNYM